MKISKKILNKIFFVVTILIGIFVFTFVITTTWIGYDVKDQCQRAKDQYKGNCVYALSKLVDDSNHSYRARNSAIWALGQIGDKDALPVLEKYYTGNIPPREPLNGGISQYELKKAINLVNGGINITGFMWKYGDL